jgi:glycosyltransferase involved in cell wall biosynthesis
MKKVSIVIPTFNQADYLQACVDHCMHQTYPKLELVIVDGGSSDGTKRYLKELEYKIRHTSTSPVAFMDAAGEIVREVKLAYPQGREIKIVSFDRDIGATRSYNEGFKQVTGEYCTYVVGDDIPHPHMIEELVFTLEETGVDFVYSDMILVDDVGRILMKISLPDYSYESCLARWYHLGVSHLYKSAWHAKVGLMDESYSSANDYDHYLRFALAGAKFYHLPKVLYSVRYHGENRKTGQHTDAMYANLLEESKRCAWRARHLLCADRKQNMVL